MYKEFPKVLYRPDCDPVTVADAAAERARGPGWYATPNDFPLKQAPELEPQAAAPAKKGGKRK